MLTWQQSEFLLKGVYLGLLVTIAWLMPTWVDLALIGAITLLIFVLFLGVAAYKKIGQGYHVKGRWFGFVFLLLIENPVAVYSGLLVGPERTGTCVDIRMVASPARPGRLAHDHPASRRCLAPVLGGAVLGGIFYGLRHVRQPAYRFWIGLAMVAILVLGVVAATYFYQFPVLLATAELRNFGLLLLLGIPGFYLLTLSGLVEESEIEIAALCAALGIGLWTFASGYSPAIGGTAVLIPVGLFFIYTTRFMPGLRVFKHALRGMSYRQMGQTRLALISLGRALHYDPKNTLARQQLWDIHRDLDFAQLKHEPELVPFLNFDFCLERISQLLQTKPKPEDLQEVLKMLDFIAVEQPEMQPICAYWRAVAQLHERNFDEAANQLTSILQLPQRMTHERQTIHFAAWNLALFVHPEMARRVGDVLLPRPGQRMDAIAAVEYTARLLTPEDPVAWDLKRQL